MKNLTIHIIDVIHSLVFRHFPPQLFNRFYLFGACDTICMSEWWSCDSKDLWCRHFERDREELKQEMEDVLKGEY